MPFPGTYLKLHPTEFTGAFNRESKQLCLIHRNKQQEDCQIEETKKYGPNERTEQNPRKKKLNKTKITNLSNVEFKTLMIRMLKELTEYGKNIRGKMKVTLSEIKIYRNQQWRG